MRKVLDKLLTEFTYHLEKEIQFLLEYKRELKNQSRYVVANNIDKIHSNVDSLILFVKHSKEIELERNNYLNQITITCGSLKDRLQTEPLEAASVDKLKQIKAELIKAFSDMEKSALDASNILFKA